LGNAWRLAQLNISDINKFTELKWRGLSQLVEEHKLHGVALQELRITDAAIFLAYQHLCPGLSLLLEPCTQGSKGGNSGGLGFLVRTELITQGLFSQITQIKSNGFYGDENIIYIEIKSGTSTIKWINNYIRSKPGAEVNCYERDKLDTMLNIPGHKIIMGDINGSIIYSQPTEIWESKGLGGTS